MSPHDALKRITASFSTPAKPLADLLAQSAGPRSKLEVLAAEIEALPSNDLEDSSFSVTPQAVRTTAQGPRWFLLSDSVALLIGFVTSWALASVAHQHIYAEALPFLGAGYFGGRLVPFLATAFAVLFWFALKGHYRLRQPFWTEAQQITKTLGFALIVDGFFQFAAKQDFSRLWLVTGWIFGWAALLVCRSLMRSILRRQGLWQIRTLLVGSGPVADEARAALRSEPALGYDIVMQIENIPLLFTQMNHSWKKLCAQFQADYVVVAMDGHALAQAEEALAQLAHEDVPYSISPPMRHMPVLGVAQHYFFSHNVTLLAPANNLEQPLAQAMKRSLDFCGAGLGLLILAPVLCFIALWVKRDGGPVFFGDIRVGKNGKLFHCLKFRSMVLNADVLLRRYLEEHPERHAEWQTFRKLRGNDPRVTKAGAFIRKWSIDELPQLINVFKGDMSLVGPRPIMASERGLYHHDLHHYCRVRPGLTGLWQVSGRATLSFADRIQMDLWYVRNWSLWHDVAILCKTIPAIVNKTGAC